MNKLRHLATIMATAALLTACQQNTYRIEGNAEGFNDGDTLLLSNDMTDGTPVDTIIVNSGKFQLEGQADSTGFYMIYALNRPDRNVQFFLEPGTISITLADDPEQNRVAGTKANDNWQQLNDTIVAYGQRMQQMTAQIYDTNKSQQEQQAIMEKVQSMNSELMKLIVKTAADNLDNELGYFILTNFEDEEALTPEQWKEMVAKMPEKYQQRQAVKDIMASLDRPAPDLSAITLEQPDGTTLNVMDEVRQHKLTLIDFWASWCGPCRQEMPTMKALYEEYKDKGLGIIGISLDNSRDDWKAAIKQLGITWPQISDLGGWDSAPAKMFDVKSIPHIVIADQQGNILTKGLRGPALEQYVKEHLQ